jgi:hypothetical protein
METGVHRSNIFKGTIARDDKGKTCELDHTREQQICGKKGGGASFKTVCHALHSTCHGKKKTFPLDEVFPALGDCFGSVT